jgi:hypothetical protein
MLAALRCRHQPMERLDKAVDVGFVIINMWADPHAPKTRCDVNALHGQVFDKSLRHTIEETQAQDVGRPDCRVWERNAIAAQAVREPRRQRGEAFANGETAPGRYPPRCRATPFPAR